MRARWPHDTRWVQKHTNSPCRPPLTALNLSGAPHILEMPNCQQPTPFTKAAAAFPRAWAPAMQPRLPGEARTLESLPLLVLRPHQWDPGQVLTGSGYQGGSQAPRLIKDFYLQPRPSPYGLILYLLYLLHKPLPNSSVDSPRGHSLGHFLQALITAAPGMAPRAVSEGPVNLVAMCSQFTSFCDCTKSGLHLFPAASSLHSLTREWFSTS